MCQGLHSQRTLMRPSPDPFCERVMSFIVMQNPERERERERHTQVTRPLWVLYPYKNLSLSCSLALSHRLSLCLSLRRARSSTHAFTLAHSFFTPLDVILPDYYSRGQSGIRTDPWHWLIGFLRCLLVFLCVCFSASAAELRAVRGLSSRGASEKSSTHFTFTSFQENSGQQHWKQDDRRCTFCCLVSAGEQRECREYVTNGDKTIWDVVLHATVHQHISCEGYILASRGKG